MIPIDDNKKNTSVEPGEEGSKEGRNKESKSFDIKVEFGHDKMRILNINTKVIINKTIYKS